LNQKNLAQAANDRVKHILATHHPDPPLPKDVEEDLDAVKAQIEKRLAKTGMTH
jgi:trimethylamine:corrinoid methyltransferase-like protein